MRVETRTEPCGQLAYSVLDVPHDWMAKPLNRCPSCNSPIIKWAMGLSNKGHYCDCGWTCGGACAAGALR